MFLHRPIGENLLIGDNFGEVKFGDALAICGIIEALRQQYGIDYKIVPSDGYGFTQARDLIAGYIAEKPDGILSIVGDSWAYFDIVYQTEKKLPELNYPKPIRHEVCINPMLGAFYNPDRNWANNTVYRLLDGFKGRDVCVVGVSKNLKPFKSLYPEYTWILDDLDKSIKAVLGSKIYIGGDTGLTHLAAISPMKQKCFFLYGCRSDWRSDCIVKNNEAVYKEKLVVPSGYEMKGYYPKVSPNKDSEIILLTPSGMLSSDEIERINAVND